MVIEMSPNLGNESFQSSWKQADDGDGSLVNEDLDLERISLELSQLLGHLAGGHKKARTELVSELFKVSLNITGLR